MPDDNKERPVFGKPPERGGGLRPTKGQKKLGLERQLPPPKPEPIPKALARKRRLKEVRRMEAEKTEWDELVLNKGTRNEVRMLGRYYELAEDVDPLGLFNAPPRTGEATNVGSLVGGDYVFIKKDSEKSTERFREGWAEVVVFEKRQEGEKPEIRMFNDGNIDRIICRAWHQGIIDRQVLKPN